MSTEYDFEVVLSVKKKREALRKPLSEARRTRWGKEQKNVAFFPELLRLHSGSVSELPRALRPDQADEVREGKKKKT